MRTRRSWAQAAAWLCLAVGGPATAATFTVTNTNDTGAGSLRQAILAANGAAGADTIDFGIPSPPYTIAPASPLPALSDSVTIAGETQPGFAGTPVVEISGANQASGVVLDVQATTCTIRAVAVTDGPSVGILVEAPECTILGCYIGLTAGGAAGNGTHGVQIDLSGVGCTVGGVVVGQGNVISGNGAAGVLVGAAGAVVRGNSIGTNPAGTAAMGNTIGVEASQSDQLLIDHNLISGNADAGVLLNGLTEATLAGNQIGCNASGTAALPNLLGIQVGGGCTLVDIGGTSPSDRNVISGNTGHGVLFDGTVTAVSDCQVVNNYIGLKADGTAGLGNQGGAGVALSGSVYNCTVGGPGNGVRNIISDNQVGIKASLGASNNLLQGNRIGTDPTGTVDLGNQDEGIVLDGVSGFSVYTSLVSGNGLEGIKLNQVTSTTLLGNLVGTTILGDAALRNGESGIHLQDCSGVVIGGGAPAESNLISGNDWAGIELDGANQTITIRGNRIGLNNIGDQAIPNASHGIDLNAAGSTDIVIGGQQPQDGNTIGGNTTHGISVDGVGTGLVIESNHLGTPDSDASLGNGVAGLNLTSGAGVVVHANHLAANGSAGISATGTTDLVLLANRIGTRADGLAAVAGHSVAGVRLTNCVDTAVGDGTAGGRNVISGNGGAGVVLTGAGCTGNELRGNWIGLKADGSGPLGNGGDGVAILTGPSGNRVGGDTAADGNVLAASTGSGVRLESNNNEVLRNLIGLGPDGSTPLGNGLHGVNVASGGQSTIILGNVIGANLGSGVRIAGTGSNDVSVSRNLIGVAQNASTPRPNAIGVLVQSPAQNAVIGGPTANDPNIIASNSSGGVRIQRGVGQPNPSAYVMGNRIVNHSIVGLDLVGGTELANKATLNDSGDGDSGPNELLNFPVLEAAFYAPNGNLVVAGLARPGSRIQFFQAPAAGYTGATRLLFERLEGSVADLFDGTGTYPNPFRGFQQGTDTTNRFAFEVPAPTGFPAGSFLCATGTLANVGTSEISAAIEVSGKAVALKFRQPPSDRPATQVLAPPIEVIPIDSAGRWVPLHGPAVNVALVDNPTGATLFGTKQASLQFGVATFADLQVRRAAQGYTMGAAAVIGGATLTAKSPPFKIGHGPHSQAESRVVLQPAVVAADGQAAMQVHIIVRDAYQNPLPNVPAGQVQVSAQPPGAGVVTITQPTTATDANGRTTARIQSSTPVVFTVQAQVQAVTLDQQPVATFQDMVVDPDTSTVVLQPDTVSADGQSAISVAITCRNAGGQAVAGVPPGAVAVSALPPGDTIVNVTQPTTATDANGRTTASLTADQGVVCDINVNVGGESLATEPTATFLSVDPDPDRSEVVLSTDQAPADGQTPLVADITLLTPADQPLANVPPGDVTITVTPDGGLDPWVTQPLAPTDADGRTSAHIVSGSPATVTVAVTARGVALADQPTGEFTPREIDPARCTVNLAPRRIADDGAETTLLEVTLRDGGDNPVNGSPPEARELRGSGAGEVTVASLGSVSDADGTFAIELTSTETGSHELIVAVDGVELPAVQLRVTSFFDIDLAAGPLFFGLPVGLSQEDALDILGNSSLHLFHWDPVAEQYRQPQPGEALSLGDGFWAMIDQAQQLRVHGDPPHDGPVTLLLEPGWNQRGNPFFGPLVWDLEALGVEVDGASAGTLADRELWTDTIAPYGWTYPVGDGEPELVFDNTQPGFEHLPGVVPELGGLWLKALRANVRLVLPPPTGVARSRTRQADPRSWAVALSARSGESVSGGRVIGASAGLTAPLPIEAPPSSGRHEGVELSFLTGDGRAALAGELRPLRAGEMVWEAQVTSLEGAEVTLTWPSFGRQVPPGWTIEMADLQADQAWLLNTRSSYRYTPSRAGEQRRFRVTAQQGALERVQITSLEALPTRGGSTRIRLQLTGPATINLGVAGLGGRQVAVVARNLAATRDVSLQWDGRDAAGRRVPHGLYRLEAEVISPNGAVTRTTRLITVR